MPLRLTDRVVAALKPPAGGKKDEFIFDDRGVGLYVRNCHNGHKIWGSQGRQTDGRQVRQPIGRFPGIPAAKALKIAKARAGRIASGADLHAERVERRAKTVQRKADAAYTVSDLIGEWLEAPKKRGSTKRPTYAQAADRRLRRVLKALLARPAASITFDDLVRACDAVEKPTARHAAVVQIKTLFRWAKVKRKIATNPVADLELPDTPPSRERCLDGEEAQAVWRAAGTLPSPYGLFVRFLLATCVRRNEAAQAVWSEFNDDLTIWTIPAARMKTSRPHLVPLPALVRDLLRALPRLAWSDRVFSVDGRRPLGGFSHLKRKVDAALVADDVTLAPWRLHDIRRSAVSWMAGEKIDIAVADLLLAHGISSLSSVGAIYQQFQWIEERREALTRWTKFLSADDAASHHA
jgi:integrase